MIALLFSGIDLVNLYQKIIIQENSRIFYASEYSTREFIHISIADTGNTRVVFRIINADYKRFDVDTENSLSTIDISSKICPNLYTYTIYKYQA